MAKEFRDLSPESQKAIVDATLGIKRHDLSDSVKEEIREWADAPPLLGEWRHSQGIICCGTLRIAKADFDTDPSDEFSKEIFDWMCRQLNERRKL